MKYLGMMILLFVFSPNIQAEKTVKAEPKNQKMYYGLKDFSGLKISAKKVSFRSVEEYKNHSFMIKNALADEVKTEVIDGNLEISWMNPLEEKRLEVFYKGKLSHIKLISTDLKMDIKNLKQTDIDLRTQMLQLVSKKNEGAFKVYGNLGALEIQDHLGDLDIKSYGLNSRINKLEGNLVLESFTGKNDIAEVKGGVTVKSNQGSLEVSKLEGNLRFDAKNSKVLVRDVKGELRGKSSRGELRLYLSEGNRVRMRNKEGKVSLFMPKNSGSHVNIGSSEGDMAYPKYLEMKRYPSLKVATGRLRGRLGGSVFVRTDKGDIRLIQQ